MSLVQRSYLKLAAFAAALLLMTGLQLGGAVVRAEPPAGVVNINQASPEQLMLLPRIGESKGIARSRLPAKSNSACFHLSFRTSPGWSTAEPAALRWVSAATTSTSFRVRKATSGSRWATFQGR